MMTYYGGYSEDNDEENDKLNALIEEYRMENERCSRKINELQQKLHVTSSKYLTTTVGTENTTFVEEFAS